MLENDYYYSVPLWFLAQLWKYNGERLENKNGNWMYLNQTWILPQPVTSEKEIEDEKKSYGHEIRDSLGSVLKANLEDKGM